MNIVITAKRLVVILWIVYVVAGWMLTGMDAMNLIRGLFVALMMLVSFAGLILVTVIVVTENVNEEIFSFFIGKKGSDNEDE